MCECSKVGIGKTVSLEVTCSKQFSFLGVKGFLFSAVDRVAYSSTLPRG
jgi:hypothetical protein